MIGIDTNVLVRAFISEGNSDERRAREFLAANKGRNAFYIATAVLLELVWTLRSRYRYPANSVVEVVGSLLGSDEFVLENRSVLEEALTLLQNGRADLPDAIIAAACRTAGCDRTVTLDRGAAKGLAGMELLP